SIFSIDIQSRPSLPSTIQSFTSIPQISKETNNNSSNFLIVEELNNTNSDPSLAKTSPIDTS
ncbi:33545_t:CDS:1, partial [Gigaspora margarita]